MLDTATTADTQERRFVTLSREIAAEAYPLDTILSHYNITPQEWDAIQSNPQFKRYFDIAVQEWNSVSSTGERIKLKMLLAIEHVLPEMVRQLLNENESLAARGKLLELMMKGADLGTVKADQSTGANKIQISINLGSEREVVLHTEIPTQTIEHDADEVFE
jgi:hypothetical protein